jgi:hypothetical protein
LRDGIVSFSLYSANAFSDQNALILSAWFCSLNKAARAVAPAIKAVLYFSNEIRALSVLMFSR